MYSKYKHFLLNVDCIFLPIQLATNHHLIDKVVQMVGCLFFNIKCSCMLLCSLSVKVLLDHYHSRQHQYETIHKACFEKVHNQLKYTNTAYFVLFCYSMQKSADNFDPIDFHQICFNWSLVKLNGIVRCNPETSASCRLE